MTRKKDRKTLTTFQLSLEEHEAFTRAARDVGMSTSQWLRTLGRVAAGLPTITSAPPISDEEK